MTNTVADITQLADVIMLVGSNPEEAHPVIGMQLRQAVERGAHLIVVDPRDIGLAAHADLHLKLRPGTNVAFANGLLHIMVEEGLVDEAFIAEKTEGFDAMRELVADCTPELTAAVCGVDPDDLRQAARLYATAERAAILYCLGVTEHATGTEGVMALSNLALACGNIGRPGCGVNPIRGQNNVQGACDMGAMPADLTGYQKATDPEVLRKFEQAWGVELAGLEPGLKATQCFGAMGRGEIKGLYIFGEDPVRTDPDTGHVLHALESLEFLVVQDLFLTETARLADVVLPGRCYAEKEGTFTNTERRVQRVRRAVEGPAGSRLDTAVFAELMRRMGYPQPDLSAEQIIGGDRPAHPLLRRREPQAARQRGGGRPRAAVALSLPGAPRHTDPARGRRGPRARAVLARTLAPLGRAARRRLPARAHDGPGARPVQRLRHDGAHPRAQHDGRYVVHRAQRPRQHRARGSRRRPRTGELAARVARHDGPASRTRRAPARPGCPSTFRTATATCSPSPPSTPSRTHRSTRCARCGWSGFRAF